MSYVQVAETEVAVEVLAPSADIVATEVSGSRVVEIGIEGPQGAKGDKGDPGADGGQPVPVTIAFAIPSATWTTVHTFHYYPDVITRDVDGNVIEGDVSYPDGHTVTISWAGAETGTVELM